MRVVPYFSETFPLFFINTLFPKNFRNPVPYRHLNTIPKLFLNSYRYLQWPQSLYPSGCTVTPPVEIAAWYGFLVFPVTRSTWKIGRQPENGYNYNNTKWSLGQIILLRCFDNFDQSTFPRWNRNLSIWYLINKVAFF